MCMMCNSNVNVHENTCKNKNFEQRSPGHRLHLPLKCVLSASKTMFDCKQQFAIECDLMRVGIRRAARMKSDKQGWRQEFPDEGAKIWVSGYYKCHKSPKKSLFTFRQGG